MSSAAEGNTEPAQPACSRALESVWLLSIADQASIIWTALLAYRASPLIYQMIASVYAAAASDRSSLQPRLGLEREPHATVALGFGVQDSEAYGLALALLKAENQGSVPLFTCSFT